MSDKTTHTEADLKRLGKSDLKEIAKSLNVEGVDELGVPKLIEGILAAQDAASTPGPEADPGAETKEPDAEVAAPVAAPKSDAEMITVRAVNRTPGEDGGFKRAFWERHNDHPEGEVWIADDQDHIVAKTEEVVKAILVDKVIEEVK